MSKIKHPVVNSRNVVVYGYDTSRFMTLQADVCRNSSWYETLGALTFGSMVIPTIPHPRCNGLRGDVEALGRDYRRVGNRGSFEKKKPAAAS